MSSVIVATAVVSSSACRCVCVGVGLARKITNQAPRLIEGSLCLTQRRHGMIRDPSDGWQEDTCMCLWAVRALIALAWLESAVLTNLFLFFLDSRWLELPSKHYYISAMRNAVPAVHHSEHLQRFRKKKRNWKKDLVLGLLEFYWDQMMIPLISNTS